MALPALPLTTALHKDSTITLQRVWTRYMFVFWTLQRQTFIGRSGYMFFYKEITKNWLRSWDGREKKWLEWEGGGHEAAVILEGWQEGARQTGDELYALLLISPLVRSYDNKLDCAMELLYKQALRRQIVPIC